jgi:PAS domain S-box-containing protein
MAADPQIPQPASPGLITGTNGPPAQQELASSLLAAIVENSDDAIASKTLDGIVTSWNRGAERLFGYTAAEMIGRSITILIPSDRSDEEPAILERIRRGERVTHYETIRRRKNGALVEISLTVSPVRDNAGRIVGASKIARDITERRRAERERELRFGELRHRVKNLLAMVQALARWTTTENSSAEQYRETLLARLEALTAAHELAFGQGGSADLATLVERAMGPYVRDRSALDVMAGPPATLPVSKVQALALVLHEFATNAVKYGALSVPQGQVRIGWTADPTDRTRLRLHWEERNGPLVQPPAASGFGSMLIKHLARGELGGPAELTFAPSGLQADFTLLVE